MVDGGRVIFWIILYPFMWRGILHTRSAFLSTSYTHFVSNKNTDNISFTHLYINSSIYNVKGDEFSCFQVVKPLEFCPSSLQKYFLDYHNRFFNTFIFVNLHLYIYVLIHKFKVLGRDKSLTTDWYLKVHLQCTNSVFKKKMCFNFFIS